MNAAIIFLLTLTTYVLGYHQEENYGKSMDIAEDDFPVSKDELMDAINEELEDEGQFNAEDEALQYDNGRKIKDPWFLTRRLPRCTLSRVPSCNGIKSNGCGPDAPWSKFIPYRSTFGPACDKHDFCYACGRTNGWSRYACDRSFHKDLKGMCKCKKSGWGKVMCAMAAASFYKIVSKKGSRYYSNKYRPQCRGSCILTNGKP